MHGACILRSIAALVAFVLLLGAFSSTQLHAGWLTKLAREAGEAGGDASKRGLGQLDEALGQLKRLPPGVGRGAVAATVGAEGHWTFVNRAGQRFTAANADEMARLPSVLFPDGPGPTGLTVYLTESTVFARRSALKELPRGARLRLVSGKRSYQLKTRDRRGGDGKSTRTLYADVRDGVVVPLTDRKTFKEIIWHLERPLRRSDVRVLALSRDGPAALPSRSRIEGKAAGPLVDRIAAEHLLRALPSLRRRTVILTGRIEADRLIFRSERGFETPVGLTRLREVAGANDIDLVVLNTLTPRQPGSRNWLWQTVDVDGLDHALKGRSTADFFNSLAGADNKVEVRINAMDGQRASLSVTTLRQGVSVPGSETIDGFIAEVISEVAGGVATSAIELDFASAERSKELKARIVPGIPSDLQFAYLGVMFAGLLGLPMARHWWFRLWPPEQRGEYGGWFGYQSARLVRLILFVLLFLPIVGLPAAVSQFFYTLWQWLTLPWRFFKWLFGSPSAEKSA